MDALRLEVSRSTLGAIFQGIDWGLYRLPRKDIEEIFLWQLRGSQPGVLQQLRQDFRIKTYEAFMRGRLALLRKLLRGGVYQRKSRP